MACGINPQIIRKMERENFGSRIGFILVSAGVCSRTWKCMEVSVYVWTVWWSSIYF